MWFMPHTPGLEPAVQQKEVEREQRTNRLLPLVSNEDPDSLPIASDAKVYSCFLQKGKTVAYKLPEDHGGYLYVVEGGRVSIQDGVLHPLDAAMIVGEGDLLLEAQEDAELLLVVAGLK